MHELGNSIHSLHNDIIFFWKVAVRSSLKCLLTFSLVINQRNIIFVNERFQMCSGMVDVLRCTIETIKWVQDAKAFYFGRMLLACSVDESFDRHAYKLHWKLLFEQK